MISLFLTNHHYVLNTLHVKNKCKNNNYNVTCTIGGEVYGPMALGLLHSQENLILMPLPADGFFVCSQNSWRRCYMLINLLEGKLNFEEKSTTLNELMQYMYVE